MIAYTDGACEPNPGRGAYAWALIDKGQVVDQHAESENDTTNNRMEYRALIDVIEKHGHILEIIFTDSQLLVNTCMTWRHKWKNNNWKKNKKSETDPIKNLDLVIKIDSLLEKHENIKVIWVKGHSGDEFNEHVDQLANEKATT